MVAPVFWPLTVSNCSDTNGNTTMGIAKIRSPLTDLENELMRAVWDHGPCSVEAVHQVISQTRSLKEGSTRTLLRRLEQKGYLKHEERDRAYIYSAVDPARSLAAKAARQLIDRFCDGSLEQLLIGMVENKVVDRAELQELARKIAKKTGKGNLL
jgi:BlaI family penicillinase repressor